MGRAVAYLSSAELVAGSAAFVDVDVSSAALEAAEAQHDGWGAARLLIHKASWLATMGPTEDMFAIFERAAALATEAEDHGTATLAAAMNTFFLRFIDLDAAEAGLARLSDRPDDWLYEYIVALTTTFVAVGRGRFDEVARTADAYIDRVPPAPAPASLWAMRSPPSFAATQTESTPSSPASLLSTRGASGSLGARASSRCERAFTVTLPPPKSI